MRYFLEVAYVGTNYAGFQVQQNGVTIQGELEKALATFFRKEIDLTCSSRTDAGVHARQNFFHADIDIKEDKLNKAVYHVNAILPRDIVLKNIHLAKDDAHCRFDALSRYYSYSINSRKDPFREYTSYYYPYKIDADKLRSAAEVIKQYTDFASFSKKNSQAKTSQCTILKSEWKFEQDKYFYEVEANRFLRGMVKALVGTMLLVGRGKMNMQQFEDLLKNPQQASADFSPPSKGLCLLEVRLPSNLIDTTL